MSVARLGWGGGAAVGAGACAGDGRRVVAGVGRRAWSAAHALVGGAGACRPSWRPCAGSAGVWSAWEWQAPSGVGADAVAQDEEDGRGRVVGQDGTGVGGDGSVRASADEAGLRVGGGWPGCTARFGMAGGLGGAGSRVLRSGAGLAEAVYRGAGRGGAGAGLPGVGRGGAGPGGGAGRGGQGEVAADFGDDVGDRAVRHVVVAVRSLGAVAQPGAGRLGAVVAGGGGAGGWRPA